MRGGSGLHVAADEVSPAPASQQRLSRGDTRSAAKLLALPAAAPPKSATDKTLTDGPTGRSLYKAPESQNDTPLSQSLFSGEWEEPRQQLLSQGTPPPQTPPA